MGSSPTADNVYVRGFRPSNVIRIGAGIVANSTGAATHACNAPMHGLWPDCLDESRGLSQLLGSGPAAMAGCPGGSTPRVQPRGFNPGGSTPMALAVLGAVYCGRRGGERKYVDLGCGMAWAQYVVGARAASVSTLTWAAVSPGRSMLWAQRRRA